MRSRGWIAIHVVSALSVWACSGAADAEKGIREANARFMEAINKGAATAAADLYADGAKILPPDSPMISGRQAIEDFLNGLLGAGARDLKLETAEVTASGELAAEVGNFSFKVQPAGGEAAVVTGKYVVVWKRQPDGAWKLMYDIFNSSAPPPAK